MKRCYFIGMSEVYDEELIRCLYDNCKQVIENNEAVEFWFFHGENDSYISSCIALVTLLKSNFPDKDIKMVRVFDPVKDDSPEDWFREAYNNDFPRSLPDKNVFAPAMDEGVAKLEHQYVRQANKVERWILRQMDIVFAYYYPNLEDSVIAQIEYAQKSCEAEVVHIRFANTEKFIEGKAETMFDERTRLILSMCRDQYSQKEISKAAGVSRTRVTQIAHKAAREIRYELMRRAGGKRQFKSRKCALCCLNCEANALQLTVFQSLLEYLKTKYLVTEFWIDEKSSNTPYGAILAKFCAYSWSHGPSAKVVLCLENDALLNWNDTIERYVPPYSSVVNLGIESSDWSSVCEEIVRQCECVVTDFAAPDSYIFKELCAKTGKNYLFNLPAKAYMIDERF